MALLKDYNTHLISSATLNRVVRTDFYTSDIHHHSNQTDLLFINDGQDLLQMDLKNWLNEMNAPLMVVGIHAGIDRKQEYGVAGMPDYMNRGSRAEQYANFIMQELLPHVNNVLGDCTVRNKYVAGFSLGGLMAFDLAMEFPTDFNAAGVFSGSFWWRSKDLKDGYVEERDRIMHAKIRTKKHNAHQRFFLQTGALDEKADRNKNGIIDSIDDTLDIIKELESIGFDKESQIKYVELADGAHDLATWSRVMPGFLNWLSLK